MWVFLIIAIKSMMHEMLKPHAENNLFEKQAFCLKNSFGLECNVRQKQRGTLKPDSRVTHLGRDFITVTTRHQSS